MLAFQLRHRKTTEVLATVLIALATIASTWSAYQAARWGGIQTFELADGAAADRRAAELHTNALQLVTLDTTLFAQYLRAQLEGDPELAAVLHERMRPQLRTMVDAWLAAGALKDPAAPATPFDMPGYRHPLEAESRAAHREAARQHRAAMAANTRSDRYVLLTVIFAAVLFFGGVSTKLLAFPTRITLLAAGAALFLLASGVLLTFPVA